MNNLVKKVSVSKRIMSVIMAIVMIVTAVSCYVIASAESDGDKISDLRDKISEYESKIEAAEGELEALKGDISKVKEYIEELDKQIALYQEQVDAYNAQIDEYEKQIAEYEAENEVLQGKIDELNDQIEEYNSQIDALNVEIEGKYTELKDLIRSNFMNGETSAAEVLLCSDDFSDYLTKIQFVSSLADYEQGLIDSINDNISKIDATIEKINEQKAEIQSVQAEIDAKIAAISDLSAQIEADKANVEANQNAIQQKVNENSNYLSKLNDQSAEYNAMIAEYEKEIAAFDSQIKAILAAQASSGTGTLANSTGLICPLQYSGRYISSGFYRNSDGSYHGALDICVSGGTYGLAISAAESGTVITASHHWSYGNYVLIDHGNGLSTLYAHCSSLAVGSGQTVSKGQTIAYVGSTGNSSGPHLHFEVRVNGSRVNPSDYISV